jgi:cbb3-type cytochrome oxidase maturation protein
MAIIYVLLPLSLLLALVGLVGYFWCVRSGQFEDLEGPAARVLRDDD